MQTCFLETFIDMLMPFVICLCNTKIEDVLVINQILVKNLFHFNGLSILKVSNYPGDFLKDQLSLGFFLPVYSFKANFRSVN